MHMYKYEKLLCKHRKLMGIRHTSHLVGAKMAFDL